MRRELVAAAIAAAILAARPVPAAEPAPLELGVGGLQPAYLELAVNGVAAGTPLVVVEEGDVWIAPGDLSRGGLSSFRGARREVDGRPLVSLRSLAPDLTYALDVDALTLRLETGAALLGKGALDLRATARPAGLEREGAPSVFLNYAARATTDETLSGALEAGVSRGPALLLGSVSADRVGGVVRGLTALTVDDPDRLLRLTAGDAAVAPDPLSGAPILGGLGIARELGLDPYLVRSPLPSASAFAATPSTVEIYVNGALARTVNVAPGTYDLSNLPVTSGANDVRIVVRDAFGRTQAIDASHYQAQGLLARGLHSFGWWAGAARRAFGTESFGYDGALVVGRHRYGFSDRATGGFRLEVGPDVQQAGVSGALAIGLGELELAGAASADRGEPGGAAFLAWRYGSRRISGGFDLSLLGRRYATSTLRADADRALWRAGAFLSFPVVRATALHLQYTASERRDLGTGHRLEARTTLRVGPRAWFALSAALFRDGPGDPAASLFAQLVVATPGGATVDASARAERGRAGGTTGAQRGLPAAGGYGYRVRADTDGPGSFSSLLQAQPSFGRFEAGYDRLGAAEVASLSAAGALVLVGGRVFATPPAEQSFALVRVPGVAGVRAYLDQRPVGRTDARGDLLVPGLLANYGNRVAIEDSDVPATHRVGRTERLVAAPRRGGAVVRFDVAELRAVEGWVLLGRADGAVAPSYGTLELDVPGGTRRSPVAEDGAFWLEDVPEGSHAARVLWRGETCAFELAVPPASAGVVDVGRVACAPPAGPAAPPRDGAEATPP